MLNVIYCDNCKTIFLLTGNILEKSKRYGLMCFSCLSKANVYEKNIEIFSVKATPWQYKAWLREKKRTTRGKLPSVGGQTILKKAQLVYAHDLPNGNGNKFVILTFMIIKEDNESKS